jgi:hypothetical protein
MFGGIGSEAISAVPVRAKTRSISGNLLQRLLDLLLHLHRLRQAGAGNAQRLDGEVAFVEAGHELAAHARGQQHRTPRSRSGKGEHHRLVVHDAREQRRIGAWPRHQTFSFSATARR